jgi:hypothetical protein
MKTIYFWSTCGRPYKVSVVLIANGSIDPMLAKRNMASITANDTVNVVVGVR